MLASRTVNRSVFNTALRTIQYNKFTTNNNDLDKKMDYRLLGKTGLKVSLFSFGFFATFGVKEGIDRAVSILDICRKSNINFFDNAVKYISIMKIIKTISILYITFSKGSIW